MAPARTHSPPSILKVKGQRQPDKSQQEGKLNLGHLETGLPVAAVNLSVKSTIQYKFIIAHIFILNLLTIYVA